jgi:hypothetical protein
LIEEKDVFLISCKGKTESEIEDIINVKIYKEKIEKEFGIVLSNRIEKSDKKWSNIMKSVFEEQ